MLRSRLKNPCIAAVCLGGTRYRQQGGDWREEATLIAQTASGWTPLINRTDKTLSASKTVLSHIL